MYVWKRKLLDKGQVCVCVQGFGNVVLEKKWTQSLNWNSCSSNRLKYDFEPNAQTHGHFILRPLFCRLCFGVFLWLQQEGAKGRAGAGCACGFTGQCCTRCVCTNSTASQVTFIVSGTSWGSKCYGKAAHCWPWLFCLLSTGQIPAGRQQWARPSHCRGMGWEVTRNTVTWCACANHSWTMPAEPPWNRRTYCSKYIAAILKRLLSCIFFVGSSLTPRWHRAAVLGCNEWGFEAFASKFTCVLLYLNNSSSTSKITSFYLN